MISIVNKTLFEELDIFNMPLPIFECDNSFNIISVNEYTKNSFTSIKVGDNLFNISTANIDILNYAINALKNGRIYFSSEFVFMLKKIAVHFYPIMDECNNLSTIICSLISEDNFKSSINAQIPYTIGSLFRTPAMNILGNLQTIANKLEENENYDELDHVNDIAKNCYYMLKSSRNLVTYYKLVNNEISFDYNIITLNTPFKNITTTIQAMLLDSCYELEVDIDDTPLVVKCDFEYITYAIFQVILNSCMFSPSDSKIKISLSQNSNSACIVITDEGIGIDSSMIERVFDPFFSNKSGTPSSNGFDLGLGLPITKRIIEGHGGSVYITSEINKGTSIALRLPLVDENNSSSILAFRTSTTKYVTKKVSDLYIYFSEILRLKYY